MLGNSLADVATHHLVDVEHVQVDAAQLVDVRVAEGAAGSNIRLKNIAELFDYFWLFERVAFVGCRGDYRVPDNVRQMHVLLDELVLGGQVCLGRDHVAYSLVECVHLVRLQVADDCVYVVENLFDEWNGLAHLDLNEVTAAFLRDLDECIAGHVLDTFVSL